MDDLAIIIGKKIYELRVQKSLSQEALADISNISRTYMGSIERGEKNITVLILKRVLDALEIDFEHFFKDLQIT